MAKTTIYHIHIRKVGGTSVRAFLERNFDKQDICPERSQVELYAKHKKRELKAYLAQYKLITGHYYNIPQFFERPRFSFTILREPIERCISEINHIKNDSRDIYNQYVHNLSPKEFLDCSDITKAIVNSQTRFLVENAGFSFDSLSDRERIKIATNYIDELDFVGVTSNLTFSLFILSKKLKLNKPTKIFRVNTEITKKGFDISDFFDDIHKLYEINELDRVVYQYAMEKFEQETVKFLGVAESRDETFGRR